MFGLGKNRYIYSEQETVPDICEGQHVVFSGF